MASRIVRGGAKVGSLRTYGPISPRFLKDYHADHATSVLGELPISMRSVRFSSTDASPTPVKEAQSILGKVPGSNLATKTAVLSAGAGTSAFLLSNEFYVVNEETVVMLCTLTVFAAIFKYLGPAYKDWANGAIQRQRDVLESAKKEHIAAVQARLESVRELGGVIDITKDLFGVSKETARLEAEAYQLEQKVAVVNEAKAVLDSWVRHEGQLKQNQQKELAESVIRKINKDLENPKVLQQILNQCIADVEKIAASKPTR